MNIKKLLRDLINEADLSATNSISATDSGRLNRMSGRDYALKGPATTRITRSDKMSLLKDRDPAATKDAMENAFKILIAAASGTKVQQITINKINMIRKQIFDILDREIQKQ